MEDITFQFTFMSSIDSYCLLLLDIYVEFSVVFHVSLKLSHIVFLNFFQILAPSFMIFSSSMSNMLLQSSTELNSS